jgi:hypothetical protein
VQVQDGLSISVLRNRATRRKDLELEIEKVSKKGQMCLKTARSVLFQCQDLRGTCLSELPS